MRGRPWGTQLRKTAAGPKLFKFEKGDVEGHEFHGNQWQSGVGGGQSEDEARAERDKLESKTNAEVVAAMAEDPRVAAAERLNDRDQTRDDPGVRNPDGSYTEKAEAENQQAISHFLDPAAKAADGERPQATFLIGKPGAGKSTVQRAMAAAGDKSAPSVLINSDELMARLPGYDPKLAPSQYMRASDVEAGLVHQALDGRYNVTFDGTGKSPNNIRDRAEKLKGLGYDIHVIHVETANSAKRAYDRFTSPKGGRYLRAGLITQDFSGIHKSYGMLKKHYAKSYQHWDNSGSKPRLIEKGP